MNPSKSLISFTQKIIDYAGLFPPAKLDLPDALKNYFDYRKGSYNFMLSRFICPARLLPEFERLCKTFYAEENLIFLSVLSSGGKNDDDFRSNFEQDLKLWEDFALNNSEKVKINSFEIRLPDDLFINSKTDEISSFIDLISDKLRDRISEPVYIFFEGSSSNDLEKNASSLIEAINIHDLKNFNSGFKLRTGGTEASAFPSSDTIAHCIRECLDRKVAMKFTAGLHHPFRHYDPAVRTMMHGFINVFGAGIIAMRHNISNAGLAEILNDEDPGNFIFTDEYFAWKDWKIELADIEYARKDLVLSYGSCSFDEPVDDLKSLNLL